MATGINSSSASISASTTSARAAYTEDNKQFVRVLNGSTAVAFLKSGNSAVDATTGGTFLGAGKEAIFEKGINDTHLAAILSTGTGTVYFQAVSGQDLYGF